MSTWYTSALARRNFDPFTQKHSLTRYYSCF